VLIKLLRHEKFQDLLFSSAIVFQLSAILPLHTLIPGSGQTTGGCVGRLVFFFNVSYSAREKRETQTAVLKFIAPPFFFFK